MKWPEVLNHFSPSNPIWRKGPRKVFVLGGVSGLFLGYLPLAPGTWGTLGGVALIYLLRDCPLPLYVLLCIVVLLMGVWFCAVTQHILKIKDPSKAVIDEIVGIMITMIGIPVTLGWGLAGFLLFRIFDIWKPAPANIFDERVKNGWGVMMDDVVAGIYGNILLHLMLRAKI